MEDPAMISIKYLASLFTPILFIACGDAGSGSSDSFDEEVSEVPNRRLGTEPFAIRRLPL